jgi:hypothetical protein
MRPATADLINYLATHDSVVMTDLYTFRLLGLGDFRFHDYVFTNGQPAGTVVISGDRFPGSPLNQGNVIFQQGPGFTRSKVPTKIGLEPAELQIEVYPGSGAGNASLIGNQTWAQAVAGGWFDGALVELDRAFLPVSGDGVTGPLTWLGILVWFYGTVSEIETGRSSIKITVKALVNLLQQTTMPRRLFQAGCGHVFGDVGCGYNRFSGINAVGQGGYPGQFDFAAEANSTQTVIVTNFSVPPYPEYAQDYIQGTFRMNSGANAGASRTIMNMSSDGIQIYLAQGLPNTVIPGDSFSVFPGCRHTIEHCQHYGNIARYGGFPFIPTPELAL